jgi:hypothetical protein
MRIEFEGSVHEFPDDFTEDDIAQALGGQPGEQPDVAVDMAKGFGYGANTGIDDMLNVIGSPVRVPINEAARLMGYEGELIPQLDLAKRANVAGPAETEAGRYAQATGEVAGASTIPFGGMLKAGTQMGSRAPGMLQTMASNPRKAATIEAASTTGAGTGVGYAREKELGPVAEAGLGLIGGFAAPNALNLGGRFVSGTREAGRYANQQIQRARNPEQAAYQDIAGRMVEAGVNPDDVRQLVTPAGSANLRGRGFSEDDIAEIISRQMAGEAAEDIVSDFASRGRPLTAPTARAYHQRYLDQNPTPINVVDAAKELRGSGNAMPLSNQARTDMAIADDPLAAERLISRQRGQTGRVADIIEQSGVEGRNFDDEIQRLTTTARQEERAAYTLARDNAQPVGILPVIRRWRARRPQQGGEINNSVNNAIDMFFRGGMVEGQRGRMRYTRAMDVIDDVPTYLERRQELDQMISRSMQDGRPTPLTRELTQLRTDLNNAARRNNPDLLAADQRFAENRTTQRILDRGGDIGKRLTPRTRRALREFNDLTPTQQELTRVAFEKEMASEALGARRGTAVADRFNSDSFTQIVEQLYPQPTARRGPTRTQQQQVYDRGQRLLQRLQREGRTTETTRDVLSGSRTAPLQDDMAEMMEGARTAANLATGRFGKLLEDLSNNLTRRIGKRAAQERIRILTETDPAQLLPMLRRLSEEATTAGERASYQAMMREYRRVGRRPATELGTVAASGEDD